MYLIRHESLDVAALEERRKEGERERERKGSPVGKTHKVSYLEKDLGAGWLFGPVG